MSLKELGSVCSFCLQTAPLKCSEFSTIKHGMYLVKLGSKLVFDAPILLGHTWGCIFEIDAQPLLFAGFFEGLTFACIVTVKDYFDFQIIKKT